MDYVSVAVPILKIRVFVLVLILKQVSLHTMSGGAPAQQKASRESRGQGELGLPVSLHSEGTIGPGFSEHWTGWGA